LATLWPYWTASKKVNKKRKQILVFRGELLHKLETQTENDILTFESILEAIQEATQKVIKSLLVCKLNCFKRLSEGKLHK